MESIRQKKVASLIQKEVGIIFQKISADLFNRAFITVTVVRMTSDLSLAKVYLSFLTVKDKNSLLKNINAHKGLIRGHLSSAIGKVVRKIPDLHFYLDDSSEYAQTIDQLLKGPSPKY